MIDVKGQEIAKKLLDSLYREGKIPSTLLFNGPPGVGKFSTALNLTTRIVDNEAKVEKGIHPDVMIVFPEFKDFDYREVLDVRKSGEYYKYRYRKGTISIDEIRKIQNYAYLTPVEAKSKVFIIIQSERMTVEAGDAFLKILEEPPEDVYFILITSERNKLKDTIISRSFNVRFNVLNNSLQDDILNKTDLNYYGRGIEETLFLNSRKQIEEKLTDLFFMTSAKNRIKEWTGGIKQDVGLDLLIPYLWKMVEERYYKKEITNNAALRYFEILKKARDYYYSNISEKRILFYLMLMI